MYLIYIDESGNTGNNLNDREQPIFVLCAMVIDEGVWLALEKDLEAQIAQSFPDRPEPFEIHATDLRSGREFFKGVPVADRIAFRDAWLKLAAKHGVKVIYRAIAKKRYQKWILDAFGPGVAINPHVAAFALVARVADDYLAALPGSPRGMFIFDDNKEVVPDVEKFIKVLRGTDGTLKLRQIIEKGFFIDSATSLPLQLCDLCALAMRKKEEHKAGLPAKSIDNTAIQLVDPLIHRGNEALSDVVAWLAAEEKKKRPGNKS